MTGFHFSVLRPLWLWVLPLALLPWLRHLRIRSQWSWLGDIPADLASSALDRALRAAASFAIVALVLAGAGLVHGGEAVEHISQGAHIILVIDRSSSMNETFAGQAPAGGEESKAAAAKQLLEEFASRRAHDRIGMVAFSTAPIFVLPLTDHQNAVRAAIDAIDQPGLAYTDVARGLAMALSMFDKDESLASRAVVLVSDGAAVIDRRVQERLRAVIASNPVHLYWLFLRTRNGPGIFDQPEEGVSDTPQEMPERHLNLYFATLGVPYRAYEAADAEALARAIDEIDTAESAPIRYREAAPQRDLSAEMFLLGAVAAVVLVLAKLAEVRIGAAWQPKAVP